jgi:uncharacterized protein (UPF0276 family)
MSAAPTAGLGLKPQHYAEAEACPAVGAQDGLWFEVHPENYMVAGGPRLTWLERIRSRRPLSLHGVGLSLAGDERPDREHLARYRALIDRFEPFVVSEHLAWSQRGGVYHPDLLPVPRSREMLTLVCRHIDEAQNALGRRLLIENPTAYLPMAGHDWDEVDFLTEIARRTGCGLLIDVNNVHVSAANMGFSAWLARFEPARPMAYLSPAARLDRAWTEAHLAQAAPVMNAHQAASLGLALTGTTARLLPSARLFWFDWSAPSLWLAHRDPHAGAELSWRPTPEGLLIHRPEDHVRMHRLSRAQWAFLDAGRRSASFAASAMAAQAAQPGVDVPALFAELIAFGVFMSPSRPSTPS